MHGPFGRSANLTATDAALSLVQHADQLRLPATRRRWVLAANYLATLAALQWSGSVVIEEAVAGTAYAGAGLGSVVNISGSGNRRRGRR